ncbi:hypothetical protein SCHPADRAFT_896458 [Schizopora paradoxa]|uniref:Uncharacterized protein n=1 Tax=Schizopora paradoxa TaxID=27342 RepID=A0A0H2R6R8_9AGAM|nr:hypothetical protein SCHPADRAFT_896458 [Schizopora paradoxa]
MSTLFLPYSTRYSKLMTTSATPLFSSFEFAIILKDGVVHFNPSMFWIDHESEEEWLETDGDEPGGMRGVVGRQSKREKSVNVAKMSDDHKAYDNALLTYNRKYVLADEASHRPRNDEGTQDTEESFWRAVRSRDLRTPLARPLLGRTAKEGLTIRHDTTNDVQRCVP